MGLSPGGRSLYSKCGLEQTQIPGGPQAGPGAQLGGRPRGEGRGVLPDTQGTRLAQRGLARPAGPNWGKGRRAWGADSTSTKEWRAGLQRRVREPELGGRGEVTLGRAQPWAWRSGSGSCCGRWGPEGGHRGCRPGAVRRPCDHGEDSAASRLPAALGNRGAVAPASCCFPGW